MSIVLYHHPYTRAASTLWALEEVGVEYELRWVDIMAGAQKAPEIVALNPMGKLPTLTDGDQVVTEVAAIALYLADRYAYGTLAPKVDDPARGTYLRWSLFAPSVIEPGSMAKMSNWDAKPGSAGWGTYDAMLTAMESALTDRAFLLGRERERRVPVQNNQGEQACRTAGASSSPPTLLRWRPRRSALTLVAGCLAASISVGRAVPPPPCHGEGDQVRDPAT